MSIDWLSFLTVFGVALVGAGVVTVLFAGGIRLLAAPRRGTGSAGPLRDEELDQVPRALRSRVATATGVLLFALAGLVALGGVVLIVR